MVGCENSPVVDGIRTVTLKSWDAFVDYVKVDCMDCPAYIFRGQADADWPVLSSLARKEIALENNQPSMRLKRKVHLDAFKHAARGRYRSSEAAEYTDWEWWARAQHHGLATPFLDWTLSPFVALFFAFEEKHVCSSLGKSAEPLNRAVFVLSANVLQRSTDPFERDPDSPFAYLPLQDVGPRTIAQSAVFLHMPEQRDLEAYVKENHLNAQTVTGCWLQKIVVPNSGRIECLKFLNKMNISRLSLFPDLDGAAKYINAMWELGFDTALGHLPGERFDDVT